MLQDLSDPRWMLQPALQPALDAMGTHGLVFDALVKGQPQLQALCEFVAAQPALTIVLDHAGKPPIASGALDDWAAIVAELAGAPDVWCKLSGLVTEAGPHWGVANLQPWVDVLLACFGPQRVIWGSDWPVLTLAADYGAWLGASEQVLRGLTPSERDAVFGLNAMRCYGLNAPPSR
jgi:L-fuconolactonase